MVGTQVSATRGCPVSQAGQVPMSGPECRHPTCLLTYLLPVRDAGRNTVPRYNLSSSCTTYAMKFPKKYYKRISRYCNLLNAVWDLLLTPFVRCQGDKRNGSSCLIISMLVWQDSPKLAKISLHSMPGSWNIRVVTADYYLSNHVVTDFLCRRPNLTFGGLGRRLASHSKQPDFHFCYG